MLPFSSFALTADNECRSCSYLDTGPATGNVEEDWNSEHFRSLRKRFLAGEKPQECHRCWISEDAGDSSRRQQSLRMFKNDIEHRAQEADESGRLKSAPLSYEVRLSNLCNFKCRTCGPRHSSRLALEAPHWGEFVPRELSSRTRPHTNLGIIDHVEKNISGIRQLRFIGGEPLIDKHVLGFLERLPHLPARTDLELYFITNLSAFPNELKRCLERHPRSTLVVSLDAIGPRGEYIRSGKKWSIFDRHLRELKAFSESTKIVINSALSVLNICYVQELLEYLDTVQDGARWIDLHFCQVMEPKHLNAAILSKSVRQRITRDIESYEKAFIGRVVSESMMMKVKSFIRGGEGDSRLVEKGLRFLDTLDELRGEDFAATLPLAHAAMTESLS